MALYIDDQKVSTEDFIKHFGINLSDKKFKQLSIPEKMIKRTAEGYLKAPRGYPLPSEYSVKTKEGKTHKVKYSTGSVRKGQGMDSYIQNTPYRVHLFMGSTTQDFEMPKHEELFLFLYTYPACEQSPVRDEQPIMYYYKDHEAIATAKNEVAMLRSSLLAEIYNDYAGKEELLKIRAQGMNISNVDRMKFHEIQAILADKITEAKNKTELENFAKKWRSKHIVFYGRIKQAIEKGVVKQEDNNGVVIWKWTSNGEEICIVPANGQPHQSLEAAIIGDDGKYERLSRELSGSINPDSVEKRLEEIEQQQSTPKGKIKSAVTELKDRGVLVNDSDTKTVRFKENDVLSESLFEYTNEPQWVAQFVKWCEKDEATRTKILTKADLYRVK